MALRFLPLPTDVVRALQNGGPDSNGQVPERQVSDGAGNPCRHCLRQIPKDSEMLVLAHCPFPFPQPYAEVGPIFLCADACEPPSDTTRMPEILCDVSEVLIRGYGTDDRIRYGTGRVVAVKRVQGEMEAIFADPTVAYIHVRSARNNCFQCRVERG